MLPQFTLLPLNASSNHAQQKVARNELYGPYTSNVFFSRTEHTRTATNISCRA